MERCLTVREGFLRPDVCRLAPPHTRGFFALRASDIRLWISDYAVIKLTAEEGKLLQPDFCRIR